MTNRISTARATSSQVALRVNPLGVDAPLAERTAAAMAGGRRPRLMGWWAVAAWVFRAMNAYRWAIVTGSVGYPTIYLLGLGLGLAAMIPVSVASGASGPVDYVTFVAPALLVSSAVSVTTEEFTFPIMGGFRWYKTYFAINATPVTPGQLAAGTVVAVGTRIAFGTAVFYLIMVVFGAVERPGAGTWMIAAGMLAALAFGLPLLAYTAYLKEEKGQFALIQRFVFMPLFLFSGTFYPLDTLPAPLPLIGWVSPVWHGAELSRWLSYGAPMTTGRLIGHVVVLVSFAVVGGILAHRAYWKRLR